MKRAGSLDADDAAIIMEIAQQIPGETINIHNYVEAQRNHRDVIDTTRTIMINADFPKRKDFVFLRRIAENFADLFLHDAHHYICKPRDKPYGRWSRPQRRD